MIRDINQFRGKYSFLSNFYSSPLRYKGKVWATAEHLYQALKTSNMEQREQIRLAVTPGLAKRMGRRVNLRRDWNDISHKVMYQILLAKFCQNPELKELLVSTGLAVLIEGNYWHDNFWGSCYCSKCKGIEGENVLGKLLMKVRKLFSGQGYKVENK